MVGDLLWNGLIARSIIYLAPIQTTITIVAFIDPSDYRGSSLKAPGELESIK